MIYKMVKLPGSVIQSQITKFLSPKNILALYTAVSPKTRTYLTKPSQRQIAKNKLPLNLGRRPISLKTSIITGKIPTLPRGTRHSGAFNTVNNLLNTYTNKIRKLLHIQKNMINELPNSNYKKQLLRIHGRAVGETMAGLR